MENHRWMLAAALLMAVAAAPAAHAGDGEATTLDEAIRTGTPSLALRYRLETVSDDAFTEDAYASTLRVALGYATRPWRGLSAKVEVQSVLDLGYENRHNDKGAGRHWNGVTDYPVVADPSLTGFYQGYLQWRSGGTTVRAGRQAILLDNVRFVGNVGWRQYHQSFDALRIDSTFGGATLSYAYVWKQNRIFGDSKAMGTHLLNLATDLSAGNRLTGYAYLVDYDPAALAGLSTATVGLFDRGTVTMDGWTALYEAEVAHQSDVGDNPGRVDAWYYRLTAGATASGLTVKLTYEVLQGSPGDGAFTTPLATLHAWNGWADMFLKTPATGLVDAYLTVGYTSGGWKALAVYHDFSADTGGADYGTELDLLLAYTTASKRTFALKAALYDADAYARDVTKIWAFTTWSF